MRGLFRPGNRQCAIDGQLKNGVVWIEAGKGNGRDDPLMFPNVVEVDFVKSGLNEAFTFRNPNVSGECGCGESFSV